MYYFCSSNSSSVFEFKFKIKFIYLCCLKKKKEEKTTTIEKGNTCIVVYIRTTLDLTIYIKGNTAITSLCKVNCLFRT